MAQPDHLRETPFAPRYPDGLEEWIEVAGHAVPLWITDPEREYAAIRTSVGALEYSMLFTWWVEGPDAVAAVDAAVTRDVARLAPGRIGYSAVCDDDGLMIDDVTVAVVSAQRVLVTGGNPETEGALRASCPPGTEVVERRDEYAVLSLQGPRSRELLARLTDVDVSNDAFPYYSFLDDVAVAGIPSRVNRVGFTAELGYEIVVPRDRALDLWDAVMAAGEDLGVEPISAAALMMARIEAGMVMGELEYDGTVSPYECRLGWTVDESKEAFRGKAALARRKGTDTGRVVTVRTDADPDAAEGARLLLAGRDVGATVMAVPSPLLGGATLATARVHRDAAQPGTVLALVTELGDVAAEVTPIPLHDPDRRRVRS